MRNVLLLSLSLAMPAFVEAQAPPPPATAPKPAPPTATPTAPPKPAQRRAQPAPATRSGMAITVTNPQGGTLNSIKVELMGATARNGATNGSGQATFPGLQAGTYRLRFSGDEVITLERDVTLRAGEIADVDVTLNPAPPREEAPAPVAAAAPPPPPVGPVGQAQIASLVDLAERELSRTKLDARNPRRDVVVACSGNTRTTLVLLGQNQPQRIYDTAESVYYVIAGQGAIQMAGRDTALTAGVMAEVPRGVPFSITRRGGQPLVLLSILSGEACEEAR